jgi:hypothetical protein
MSAFDPLFRGRRRRMYRQRAVSTIGSRIGVLGMAGLGYAIYRFLQTERGRAVKDSVVEQVRHLGERVRSNEMPFERQQRSIETNPSQF